MNTMFMLNLVLALIYVLLTGNASFATAGVGFVIGFVILAIVSLPLGKTSYPLKLWRLGSFVLYFLRILIKANLEVAWEIITPGFGMKPRIVRYDVDGLTDAQVLTLASTITLTPGTLSADISPCGRYLYIHAMYAEDRRELIASLDEIKGRILREVFG